MIVSLIAAASENNVIGKDNRLLWNLPNDMRFFKNTTWGMPVIMGRKTCDSMKGEPLPGRFNIVVTRQTGWSQPGIQRAGNIREALALAEKTDCKEVFVIGGGEIYKESLPLAHRIYLTRVHGQFEGDAFFPEFSKTEWQLISNRELPSDEKHAYAYSFQLWERKTN